MIRRSLLFLFATLGWTWLFWFAIVLLDKTTQDPIGRLLYYVGGAGPLTVALAFLYSFETKTTRVDFWNRLLKVRTVPKKWFLCALTLPLVFNCLAILSTSLLADELTGYIPTYVNISQPAALFTFLLLRFILGPLPEEIGWRGYALERLQVTFNPIVASLVIWLFWWLWHLPLYCIHGTYQNGAGLFSNQFFVFAFGLMAESFLFTWLYNNSGKSILVAVLFHFSINASGELIILNPTADFHRLIWSWMAVVVALYASLGRRNRKGLHFSK